MDNLKRLLFFMLIAVAMASPAVWAQSPPDFSGVWKQANERCVPPRKGNVTLRIEQHGPQLIVETTIVRGAAAPRKATQRYTTDGVVSTSTGTDGDEFHTSIAVKGDSLIFTIEEHEDGRIIRSQETWRLIENGAALERVRQRQESGDKQVQIYTREKSDSGAGGI